MYFFVLVLFILSTRIDILGQPYTPVEIYQRVNPAVVTIFTVGFNGKTLQQGSGVVLNKEGWIVTNYHVFNGGKLMTIKQGDKFLQYSDVIGVDANQDLLILKVIPGYFSFVPIGNPDSLKVGEKIFTIGSPLGYENTLSSGLVSGLRSLDEKGNSQIQISASISAGSSGGAVVNERAELIGVSTKTVEGSQNVNFAVPISEVFKIKTVDYKDSIALSAFNFYWQGKSAYNSGIYDMAASLFQKTIELDKKYKMAYFNLGRTFIEKREYYEAITMFRKVLSLDSGYVNAYVNIAFCYDNLKKYAEAIESYKKSLEYKPNDAAIYNNIGIIYSDFFIDYNTAIEYFNKALDLDANFDIALLNIGDAYYHRQQYGSAIEVLEKAIKINPEQAYSYGNLGACYYKSGDFSSAVKNLKKSIKLDPDNVKNLQQLGEVYYKIDDFGQALDYFRKVIFNEPENALVLYLIGQCYKNLGNKKLYKKYNQKALTMNEELKNKSSRTFIIDK